MDNMLHTGFPKHRQCWYINSCLYTSILHTTAAPFHPVFYLIFPYIDCALALFTFSPAAFSSLVSPLLSLFTSACPVSPLCFSAFPPSPSPNLTFRIASSKLGTSIFCRRASASRCRLTWRPLAAARTSLLSRARTRSSMRCSSVSSGGRASTGVPNGAMMDVTMWRMDFEVRHPEAMRTTSPSTREEVGSETRCVVEEGKCWKEG